MLVDIIYVSGEVPEWPIGLISKISVPETEPRVRIPPSPQRNILTILSLSKKSLDITLERLNPKDLLRSSEMFIAKINAA